MAHLKLVASSSETGKSTPHPGTARPGASSGASRPSPAADQQAIAILLSATGDVVGQVSKVFQTMQAVLHAEMSDGARRKAAKAFDGLPAWQRSKIAVRAVEAAARTKPHLLKSNIA